MNTHKFDVEDAKKYGVEKAILLEHLKFHQQANEGNEDLIFEGKSYAFIKPSTIKSMYPYLNYSSVRRWLRELEDDGIIESIKPESSGGYHLKYYHVLSIDQNDQSNDQVEQSKNDQNDQSSILPNEEPYEVPSKDDLIEYFTDKGDMIAEDIPLEAENFIIHYADLEWKKSNGKRIKNWRRQAGTWNNKYQQYNRDRIKSKKESTPTYHQYL